MAEDGGPLAAATGAITTTSEMAIATETTAMKDGTIDVKREVQDRSNIFLCILCCSTEITCNLISIL